MKWPVTITYTVAVDTETEEEAQDIVTTQVIELLNARADGRFVAHQNDQGQTVVLNSEARPLPDTERVAVGSQPYLARRAALD